MDRNQQLDAVRIQLLSQRPSDMWRGMEQIRQWLKENPEDTKIYSLLTDSIYKNKDLQPRIRELLQEMTQNGSKLATEFLRNLPINVADLQADADDAYYASEYNKALDLYQQILKLEPSNLYARGQLQKAQSEISTQTSNEELPRDAVQYFRRARSYIATEDYKTALILLEAAIESAAAHNMNYVDAINLRDDIFLNKLAGDSTTDAPPPDVSKKKKKGK